MPYQSRHTGALADLLMRQGDIDADRAARSGQLWGNVVRGVAGIPAGIQQRKAAEQAAQLEQAQAMSRLATDEMSRRNTQDQIDERGNQRMDAAAVKDEEETAKRGAAWLIEVASAPDLESKRMAYKVGRDALIAEGRLKPNEAPSFYPGDSWLRLNVAQKYPELGKAMFPEPNLHNVPAGTTVIDQNNPGAGAVFAAPPKAPDAPAVGSFEDFVVRKYGAQPTPEQIAEGRKIYQQADDRPRITVNTPSGMTPTMEANVINRLTTQWGAAVKPVAELSRQVKLMDAGMEAVKRGDMAQGSQVLLVTFQKILDPPSVVRESEYMRSAAGQSMANRVRGAMDRLQRGGAGVTPEELGKFAQLAREAAQAQATGYVDAVKERIGRTADRYKIPRELVFEDFDFAGALSQAPSAPSPAGTIRARDPQGKVHEAPAGTPLPAGWTLER